MLPCSAAIFTINGMEVQSKYPAVSRTASTMQELRTYMDNKYCWTTSTADKIDWHCHGKVLAQFKGTQQRCIKKFIHKWLPVNGHKTLAHAGAAQQCPHCKIAVESQSHFLTCNHITVRERWIVIRTGIKKFLAKKHADPNLSEF
jgi:hypothetical protein